LWLISLGGLALLIILALTALWFLRSDRFNRFVAREIDQALRQYGLRAEVGAFELGRGWRTATLREVKIFNQQTGQLIATLDRATVTIEIREPFALRLSREIELEQLELAGLEVSLEFDEQGRSNFFGVHQAPPRAPRRITFDYSNLVGSLVNGAIHVNDRQHDFQAELRNLRGEAGPVPASDPPQVRAQLTAGAGFLRRDERQTGIESFEFIGRVMASGADLERIQLRSEMAGLQASGRLDQLSSPQYRLDTTAQIRLEEVMKFFAPEAQVAGVTNFSGRVTGEGASFRVNGQLSSEELRSAGIVFRDAQVEQVTLEPQAGQWQFTASQARAQRASARELSFAEAVISQVNGALRDGRAEIRAARASVKRVNVTRGEFNDITLQNITATLGSDISAVRGRLSTSGGEFADIEFGRTSGELIADQRAVSLNNFSVVVAGGKATGDLMAQISSGATSRLATDFTNLQTSEVFSILAVNDAPLAGTVEGRAALTWPGTNLRLLSGEINARLSGQTTQTADAIPLTGEVVTQVRRGVFNFDNLTLRTDASTLGANGTLALSGESNLSYSVTSTRAEELQTIFNSFRVAEQLMATYEPQVLGDFEMNGTISGPLRAPTVTGELRASSFALHDETLGRVSGRLFFSPTEIRFEDGLLTEADGGTLRVSYIAPRETGATAGRLDATLEQINADSLIIAAGLPTGQKLIEGQVSGETHLTGLPAAPEGTVRLSLLNGTIAGQPADAVNARVNFNQQTALLEEIVVKLPQGRLTASGTFNLQTSEYQFQGQAEQVDLSRLASALEFENVQLSGTASATFQVSGDYDQPRDFRIELSAQGQQVAVNNRAAGNLNLTARTSPGGRIELELTSDLTTPAQPIVASIELNQPGRPMEISTDLTNFALGPILSIFAPDVAELIDGTITGTLRLAGPLVNEQDELSLAGLRGRLTLTDTALQVAGNPINLSLPFTVALDNSQLSLESTRITASGADLRIGGRLGLRENAPLDFSLNGTVQPNAFLTPGTEVSLGGTFTIDARVKGTFSNPQLAGQAQLDGFSFSSLNAPVTLDEGSGRILFSGNRITLENFNARAGDGTVRIGGALTLARLRPGEWQFDINADDADVLYRGLRATADASLALRGNQQSQTLSGTITVPLAEYTSDFTFAETGAGRGGFSIGGFGSGTAGGTGSGFALPPVALNVRLEARDSMLIRNEQVNTVASAILNLSGTLSDPDISGRVTLEGGTITFRGERYDITTGTLELPGGFGAQPSLDLVAEGEVSGYQVYVGFNGELNDLAVTLRSEPDLTRAEIISLITTGRAETGALGSDDLVRSGLGTAASLLTEELISKPVERETERLLGINRFQIDPVLRANANPAARLTIGRQIARGLSFIYSTNLASEQDQTALFEYNFSNRFSALASYTQGGSATRSGTNDNDFTIEIRGRKRFALGADRSAPSAVAGAVTLPRPDSRPRLRANVDVNKPDTLRLSNDRVRELLPVMREGFSRALVRLGERNLTSYLQEQGYFFAEVDSRCDPADCSGDTPRVIYDVSPGERYNLTDLRLEGTQQLSESDLSGELQSQESSPLAGIPLIQRLPFVGGYARGITSNDRLRNDRAAIREQMAERGYRSADVNARLAVSPDNENLVVVFEVTEGPRTMVSDVALRGNTVVAAPELREAIPTSADRPFSPTSIREGAQRIREAYAQRGFLDAKVEASLVELPDNRVRLIYEISEGARAVAREIEVTGEAISREDSIRRFLNFKPGDRLTPQLLRTTQRELYATGAFREVTLRTEAITSGDESARRVTLGVTEASPLLLVYGLGYSTDDGPRALAQLTHTNLFGRVISGSLRLRGSRREQLAQLQFTDLRPFGSNWATTFSAFYNRDADLRPFVRRRLVGGRLEPNTSGRSFGINRFASFIQTERKLGELTSLRFRYSFENAKLFNLQNIPETEITRNERAIRLGLFAAGISRDTRDSALNPTRGQLFSADHSIAARVLGGNESFNKFFGNYQRYETVPASVPLLGNSVVAIAARVGLASLFKPSDRDQDGVITEAERKLPISERFFAGGATTLRGFRFEEAGPQGILEPRNANELPTLVPLGGDALAIFNFELRYPLTRRLQLVPFYDLGNVFARVRAISFSRMTNTAGLGLRINTPLGPIGVDYGYLLDPPAFTTATGAILRQPRGVFHIRIGQTF
jgi:outer membrane protein insertion porin family